MVLYLDTIVDCSLIVEDIETCYLLLGEARLAVGIVLPGPAVHGGEARDGGGHCQQENNLYTFDNKIIYMHTFLIFSEKSLNSVFREFRPGESPLPSLYNTVSSVMFAQNMMMLHKQTRGERRYFDKSYR